RGTGEELCGPVGLPGGRGAAIRLPEYGGAPRDEDTPARRAARSGGRAAPDRSIPAIEAADPVQPGGGFPAVSGARRARPQAERGGAVGRRAAVRLAPGAW